VPDSQINQMVWKATPNTDGRQSGGFNSDYQNVNHTETYRFTIWLKKTNSNSGTSYLGPQSHNNIITLNGTINNNPYFWYGDLPQLNKWYLIVGFVHGSNYNSNENYGGIYDPETGEKIRSITDFKFKSNTPSVRHRSYLWADTNTADRQYFYAPRLEQVNGEEPTVENILGLNDDEDCNYINYLTWNPRSDSAGGFFNYGATSENKREYGKNHIGEEVVLWTASPDEQLGADGGWNTIDYNIDNTKTHRFSVWIKKTNSNEGTTYFGPRSVDHILRLDGVLNDNPYFWYGDLPKLNRWYLLVGYVHPHTYTSTASLGKIYDGVTGEAVQSTTDFKFNSSANKVKHRAYLYRDANTEDRQYFYTPRIDELSGCEPTINELLRINENSNLIFSFDTAGNQNQRFYCSDPEYCSPIAARKKEIEEYTSEEELITEEEIEIDSTELLKIYPNPTAGTATIQLQEELLNDIEFIKVFTTNSVLIKELKLTGAKSKFTVDLSEQPIGLYFVHAHLKDGSSITKKILKK